MNVQNILGVIYIMKNFLTVLLGFACIAVLYLGHTYWNEKIQASAKNKNVEVKKQVSKPNLDKQSSPDIISLTENWPENAISRFEQTLKEKKTFKILFVGSPAIGSENEGIYPIVKQKLVEAYGEKNIQIDIKTVDSTSTQLINDHLHEEIASEAADLVVIEPLTLMDNGEVAIEASKSNLTLLMEEIKAQNPEATIIIQPSYPLYNAKFYPIQVNELKNYSAENQITYLDHWTAWPDPNTEEIKQYLQLDQTGPSNQGIQVWSDYLIQFFIKR